MIQSDNIFGKGSLSLGGLDFDAALAASGRPAPDRSFLNAAIEATDINQDAPRQLEPVVNPMQRFTDVCLFDEDEEAAERVKVDVLVTETARGDVFGQNMLMGVELADMLTGGDVYETAERFIGALPREQQQAWRDKLNHCHTQSDGQALVGEMFRNGVVDTYRKQFIEQEKKSAEASLILNKMGGYVAGDAMAADGNELTAGGMSEAELAKLAGVVDGKKLKDARAVRDWMRTYVRPLDGEEDAEAVLRQVDSLEDELFELIGQDADRAAMAYEAMMHWAEQLAESNKVDISDELVVAVGKKLSNWSQVEGPDLYSWNPVGMPDSTIANQVMLRSGEYERQRVARAERDDTRKKHQNARAILRAAINRSTELGSKEGWWRGAGRSVSKMVGDTLPYLIPGGFGTMAGTADLAVSGMTERMDALQLSGMSGEAAAGQSVIETVAQGAAELLPWGRVGGSGLSAFLRKMGGRAGGRGATGSISKWLINYTQKSVPRALVAEAGANFIDEGVLEPIASGIMQYGAERAFDMLGVPHGESRSWLENFDELGQIWGDSRQLAALAMFSAGLSGAGTRGIMKNVRWFADNRNMWLAQGFTEKQVDEIMASPDRWETGQAMLNAEWADAEKREAMKQRRLVNNKKLAERGEVLFMSGAGAVDSGLTNDNLAVAYAGVWNTYADKGYLPQVEAAENGMVHVFKKGKDGEMAVDLTLTPEDADAYLQGEFDLAEQKLLRRVQQEEGSNAEPVNLKGLLLEGVDQVAGGALLREAERSGVVRVENLLRQLPPAESERIGKLVQKTGGVTAPIAAQISDWAQGMIDGLVADGVSPEKARSSRDYAEGAVMSLGSWAEFANSFAERGDMVAPGSGEVRTTLFRTRGGKKSVVDNRTVLGSTLFGVAGHATSGNTVEDVTESVFDEMVQVRAQGLAEEAGMAYADAEAQAWSELASIVGRARAAVLKADPKLHIPVPSGSSPMSVIEAFSDIAGSEFILSAATPGWLKPLVEAAKGVLTTASAADAMKSAWSAAIEHDPQAAGDLVKLLDKVGVRVGEALSGARIEQADVVAWRVAHGIVMSKANGPDGAGGLPVSKAVADAEEEEQAILHREAAAPEERVEEVNQEQERAQEYAERVSQVGEPESSAPAHLKGIFVGDNCNYNPAGGYYFGLIEKGKLKHATEQVKVGTKGKHGVIAGRELTGNFQASAAPLYVWLRKDGSLWLISGRHRYELMMRDENMPAHTCYVFLEDAEHDEKWARMMDYENNMRDDQADEVTAGTYVRETGLSDAELEKRGLMRNASRSKRGALIGRHAREELWTRFSNGKIKPKDAEIVCELTRYIKDQSRVDEIQRRCCMLLDNGKSWDYIGGMVQLMVQAELEQGEQGWFNFGADFEAALERAATWIEKALRAVNENIELAKRGRDMSGKKADKAARLGIVTSAGEDVQQTLQDLQILKGKLELIGSYPELRQQAEMWDGESDVDPVGWMLQQQALENERMAAEKELEAEEYLKQQQAEATGSLFSMSMDAAVDLQTVTNAWQNTLQRFVVMPPAAGTAPYRKDIVVCPTPAVMQMVGVTAWDIVISPSVLVKCLHKDTVLGNKKKLQEYYPKEKHEHDIELSEMMQLPAALADPVCIVVSDTPGCVEVITELKEGNKNVLVAVQLNSSLPGRNNNAKVNRIASLYGKDNIEAILTHPRLYWNKAKARVWMKNGGLQLPTVVHQKQASGHKVLKPEDLVKYKQQNKFSFSMERNLAAVHSLSPEKFLSALELGGMPMPSVAITRLDKPYSWGGAGNIMLVGRPAMVDPKEGTEVYTADAWTGYVPRLVHKVAGKEDRSAASVDLYDIKEKYQYVKDGDNTLHSLDYRISEGEKTERYDMDEKLRSTAGKALFAWQSGYRPRPKMKDAKLKHEWLTRALAKDLMWYTQLPREEYEKRMHEMDAEIMNAVAQHYANKSIVKNAATPEIREKRLNTWVDSAMRAFWRDTPILLKQELGDVANIGKRVLDTQANLEMLAKFADKHKRAFEAWVEEKLNKWYSKERYIADTKKEATLDNITEYMLLKKGRNKENDKFIGYGQVRAMRAQEMRSLENIKEQREKLVDSKTSNEQKSKSNELMYNWQYYAGQILNRNKTWHDTDVLDDLMRVLAEVKGEPSAEKLRVAVAKKFRYETRTKVQELLNNEKVIGYGVEALKSLRSELEDYMEAVPQRAVRMNEWEYAVMPESLKKNKAIMAGLRENGIRPRFHDGTEEGRKAALAGLVNDARVSFSMTRATQRSLELLESRSEEEVAQQIMDDLRKACERLAVVLADDGADSQRGEGLRVYAEMQALLSAVRQALPEKYLKQGNLEMLLRWAAMYARMAQDGQVPAKGTIKGEAFEKFVSALTRQTQRDVLQGMSEEEVRDALMEMAGQKMEVYFQKVAHDSVQRIDRFLKDRALERIEWVYKHAYPTREEGKAWSRGKMATADYLLADKAWKLVQSSLGQRKEAEKEMTVLRRAMRSVREEMKHGTVTAEDGKRRLVKLQEQLAQKELEAMQTAAEQQAGMIESLSKELEGLDTASADFEDSEAKANENMALQQTFGNWYYKDALEARRAARVFEDMVLRGRKAWAEKLQNEREHIAWQREQILAGFEVSREEATNTRMEKRNEYRTALNRQVVAMGKGLMNFGHLMIALRPLLGKSFCDKKREQISRMHVNTMAFNTELKHWMFETLRDITGLQTEEEQQLWLQKQNMKAKTGIRVREREVKKATLTYAEAKKWLAMTEDQAAQERVRILADAAGQKRVPGNVPTSSMMEDLRKMVALYEADKHGVSEADKKFRLESEEWWEIELNTTKDAVLFGILTFEQPDYEHLMHVNGITPETLDQMRRYVGPQMLSWGYAMREKLSEHGMNVAQVFEAYTGIPFNARESYFKGVFDQGAMKEQTLDQAVAAASGASGTGSKFGSLIPRRYHQSKINWDTSAAGVFVTTMQQQNNYVQTSEMIRSWRALLADKNFSARVEAEIGAGTMQQVRGWIELIEGAVAADVKMAELSRRMMRRLAGGYAKARLGGNIRTIIKQVSALLNGYAGGYVPDSWMLNNELCQEMTYRKIGFGEYMQALARVLRKRGSLKRAEVKDQAYIYARKAVEGDGLIHVAHLAANQNLPGQQSADTVLGMKEVPGGIIDWLSRKAEKATERMMNWIAVVDAEMCTASALAVADVAYRNAVEQDKQGVIPDEVKRAEALRIAGMALDVAAQPQLRTQKGYWAASGAFGAMGDFLFMFRSDTLSKAGLWIAQMTSAEKMPAVGGWLAFGVMNSLVLAMLEGLRGNLGDDDDEWWQYALVFGADVLTNDVSALPVVGDVVRKGRSLVMGERYFSAGEIAQILPFAEVFEYGKREFKYIKNGASWDKHWNATAGLLSALGSSCAVCQESTIGPLANVSSLTMAAGMLANTTKFVQGLIKLAEELTD